MNEVFGASPGIATYLEPAPSLGDDVNVTLPAATSGDQASGLRLLDMLNLERIEPNTPIPATLGSSTAVGNEGSTTKTLGDAILARIDAVGANYKQNVNRAYAALEKSPRENTVEDLLKMQLDLAVVSLEVEVVGKGVQKAVQHVDTLSKLQ